MTDSAYTFLTSHLIYNGLHSLQKCTASNCTVTQLVICIPINSNANLNQRYGQTCLNRTYMRVIPCHLSQFAGSSCADRPLICPVWSYFMYLNRNSMNPASWKVKIICWTVLLHVQNLFRKWICGWMMLGLTSVACVIVMTFLISNLSNFWTETRIMITTIVFW